MCKAHRKNFGQGGGSPEYIENLVLNKHQYHFANISPTNNGIFMTVFDSLDYHFLWVYGSFFLVYITFCMGWMEAEIRWYNSEEISPYIDGIWRCAASRLYTGSFAMVIYFSRYVYSSLTLSLH